MKKFFYLAAAMVMAATSVKAQSDGYDTKHEIGISYGVGSASDILSFYTDLFSTAAGDQSSFWGPVGVEYFYHLSPAFSLGGVAEFAGCKATDDKTGSEDLSESFITLMPSVKYNWLRKKHFGMYSGLSAGVMFLKLSANSNAEANDPDAKDETLTTFMFQLTALGMEFGGPTFRGFVEGGLGEKGVLCAGLRYKF